MALATDKQTDNFNDCNNDGLEYQREEFYLVSDGDGWEAYGFGTHDEAQEYERETGNECTAIHDWNTVRDGQQSMIVAVFSKLNQV